MAVLGGELDVMRIMITAADDNEILYPARDVELPVAHETEIARTKKRPIRAGGCVQMCAERLECQCRFLPVSTRNVRTAQPDLADLSVAHRARVIHDDNILAFDRMAATH